MDCKYIIEFEKRSIALAGDRNSCKHFYMQFHPILDIQYIFYTNIDYDGSSVENIFDDIRDIKYIPLNDRLIAKQNILLVLCVEQGNRKPYDQLLFNKGFEWGENYIDSLYVIQYYRNKHNTAMEEKNIWIFGAGNNGRYFYEEYKATYRICGFISNYEEEKEYLGLPVIRPKDILKQRNYFIVICSDSYVLMAKQLCELGCKGDKDYSFADTLPKKLFVAVGTCQIVNAAGILCENRDFQRQYYGCIFFDTFLSPCDDSDNRRLKYYGNFCGTVFYNLANVGTAEQRNYGFLIDRYYYNADRIFMPFYYFTGQLMQATDTENDYAVTGLNLAVNRGVYFWFRGDKEINCMLENNYCADEVLERISGNNYWPKEKIVDNFKKQLKKIEVLDRLASFPIKQFIEQNYQKELVFSDGTHFGYHLCFYLGNEIAKYLHLEPMDEQNIKEREDNWKYSVMPIYPCVRRALGMKAGEKFKFYNIEKNEIEYLDFEEYAKKYIQYVIYIREVYREYGAVS